MPTQVLITTDTELSAALHHAGMTPKENFDLAIEGRCGAESYGISYQMRKMEENGLKGVFFVDPMPALAYGEQIIADIVGPIVERGHEVQLHLHTEWLGISERNPLGDVTGRNIGDFSFEHQLTLLRLARDLLIRAGAPAPIAFRAGNFGSNDDTLRALASLGLAYDSSFNPAYADKGCELTLPQDSQHISSKKGVRVVPVSVIEQAQGQWRPAQICALSTTEMNEALDHSAAQDAGFFNIVSHSFELVVRKYQQPHRIMIERFNSLCRKIAGHDGLKSAGFFDLLGDEDAAKPLPPSLSRRLQRVSEQIRSRLVYEGVGPMPPAALLNRLARRQKN